MSPRIGSLFSGYGGLDLGVMAALGGEVVWHSDILPASVSVLKHRFPGVPNLGDIKQVDWSSVEPVDVITGGFPCQDVSTAGMRRGLRPGTRSGLWSQFAYAIDQLRPSLVVIENVRGLLSAQAHSDVEPCPWCVGDSADGSLRALGAVLGDLAELGYDASWHGVRASDVGAPHGRFRVFVLAYPADAVDDRPGVAERDQGGRSGDEHGVPEGALLGEVDRTLLPTPTAWEQRSSDPDVDGRNLLPMAVRRLEGEQLLATPAVNDMGDGKSLDWWNEWAPRQKAQDGSSHPHGASLAIQAQMLPTPVTSDKATPVPGGQVSRGYGAQMRDVDNLFPTPQVQDSMGHTPQNAHNRLEQGRQIQLVHAIGLMDEETALLPTPDIDPLVDEGIVDLLPTPNVMDKIGARSDEALERARGIGGCSNLKDVRDTEWGAFTPAVRRWEALTGRPAPAPTTLVPSYLTMRARRVRGEDPRPVGMRGSLVPRAQLAPAFVEWMMGLPAGWVTEVPGINRSDMLTLCGNGVVPQQAEAAVRMLLMDLGVRVADPEPEPEPEPERLLPTPVVTDSADSRRHTTTTGVMHSGTSLSDAMVDPHVGAQGHEHVCPTCAVITSREHRNRDAAAEGQGVLW